nr:putative reverse transcriptase domain-containing protein [Tanacetum cinerariifolium]
MEEMLYKFIEEGKCEHEEMRAFIYPGANKSLMPYTMYENLGLEEPKATRMSLELADRSIQCPRGIIENMLIKVDKFVVPIDFVILDMPEDSGETTKPVKLREHLYSANANEIDEKKHELKDLPNHLEYTYLYDEKSFPIIISSELSNKEKSLLLQVSEKQKGAIAWKCHSIPKMFKPISAGCGKNKIVKLLDSGLIYPISDSSWVNHIHVVPKKGGMTVVLNNNSELIPSHTVSGWRVCIDDHKLNDATRKDHFPFPFIDQMLERLCGNEYYCFLDGFSGLFQIPIALEDQEKTTFTCPYGIFAYQRIPFGLCNAPATFQ